jgi:hypothetical protein
MSLDLCQGAVWPAVAMVATAVGLLARAKRSKIATRSEALHGISFSYSMQKDAYADYEFLNDVGFWDSDFIFCLGETSNILEMPTCSPPPLCQFVFGLASGG